MWELDHKEGWEWKKWFFWSRCLRRFWVSLRLQRDQPVHPKGNQSWIFIGGTDAEAEAPILWPPDAKSQFFGKDPDAGKDWGWEEKEVTEDEMVVWHYRLNEHEFEQTWGDNEGRGSLTCFSSWVLLSQIQLSDWTTIHTYLHVDL